MLSKERFVNTGKGTKQFLQHFSVSTLLEVLILEMKVVVKMIFRNDTQNDNIKHSN